MKIYVYHSVALGRRAYGKGTHDLPPAEARLLLDRGLAKEVVKIEIPKYEVVTKNIGSTDNKRSNKRRGKKPMPYRPLG